ncbi:MAG: hypothetical protein QGD94_11670, partial [Planctomycetia bacterium]|nr:hypothetical protein [Planctomycetia bacterium]
MMRFALFGLAMALSVAMASVAEGQGGSLRDLRRRKAFGPDEVKRVRSWLEAPVREIGTSLSGTRIIRARKLIVRVGKVNKTDTDEFHQMYRKQVAGMMARVANRAMENEVNWINLLMAVANLRAPESIGVLIKGVKDSYAPGQYWGAKGLADTLAELRGTKYTKVANMALKAVLPLIRKDTDTLILAHALRAVAQVRTEQGGRALAASLSVLSKGLDLSAEGSVDVLSAGVAGLPAAYRSAAKDEVKKKILSSAVALLVRIDPAKDSKELLKKVDAALVSMVRKRSKLSRVIGRGTAAEIRREQLRWVK